MAAGLRDDDAHLSRCVKDYVTPFVVPCAIRYVPRCLTPPPPPLLWQTVHPDLTVEEGDKLLKEFLQVGAPESHPSRIRVASESFSHLRVPSLDALVLLHLYIGWCIP
jgi:hypothetical protein